MERIWRFANAIAGNRNLLTAAAVAALVILLDQTTKLWLLGSLHLAERGSVPLVWPLRFTLVWNRSVAFGLFPIHGEVTRWAYATIATVAAVVFLIAAMRASGRATALVFGLIIGGALGNAIDRIHYGAVADFIDASALYFPWVFNIADSALNIAIGLWLIVLLVDLRTPAILP